MKKSFYLILLITLVSCGNEISATESDSVQTATAEESDSMINTVDSSVIEIENDSMEASTETTPTPMEVKVDKTAESAKMADPKNKEPSKKTAETIVQPSNKEIKAMEKKMDIKEEEIKTAAKDVISPIKKEEVKVEQVQAEIHKTWDDLVRKHISSSGKVNYSAFVKDKAKVEKYIKELQSYHSKLSSWGKNKRLAYWINTYNAVTIKLIIDNYPVTTIKTLKGGKPWDTKLITLGGKSYTLNDIENKVIRPKFKEPRIHFAVNCAAKSCPKIMNKAWTEGNVQRYLTKQTKAFLANTTENQIEADKASISKIFEWYKADFGGSDEKLIAFINKYSTTKINAGATITFNDYNWKLNK